VSYEKAFEALAEGDFKTASLLLEQAARETGYGSDLINNACTLALYRAGEKARLADAAFLVGESLADSDPGSAMDYFQRAFLGGLDATRSRRVGEIFEKWASPKPERSRKSPIKKVAHVVGSASKTHPPASYVALLARSLRDQGVESVAFTTEWSASWFVNPAGEHTSKDSVADTETIVASTEGDFAERADRIAAAIRARNVDAAFFHSGLNEQITARVAALRPAPIQVNISRNEPLHANCFDGYLHLSSSDIENRMQALPPNTRQQMGLESATSVSATFGDLGNVSGSGYLHALGDILNRFPKHFHLFAGGGNVKAVRAYLHGEGVLPRVRFLGPMADLAPVMDVIDVYLGSFPHSDGGMLLEAMGAGKPAVVMRYPADSPFGASSSLVGVAELSASGEGQYAEIASRLIRDADLRSRLSAAVSTRFQSEFHPALLGPRYIKFIETL